MNNIPYLERGNIYFPSLDAVREDGLVCVSEGITAQHILAAYRLGIFPWHEHQGWVFWFYTTPRTVLFPQSLHLGRSLRKVLRHAPYRVCVNTCFSTVMTECAKAPRAGQEGTWISQEFQRAYGDLHKQGYAHSFECFMPNAHGEEQLVGGLYGVQIGTVFYGESMFSTQNNASKIAFAHAVPHLAQCGVRLIDCQQDTVYLRRFGSQLLQSTQFQAALKEFSNEKLAQNIKSMEIEAIYKQ